MNFKLDFHSTLNSAVSSVVRSFSVEETCAAVFTTTAAVTVDVDVGVFVARNEDEVGSARFWSRSNDDDKADDDDDGGDGGDWGSSDGGGRGGGGGGGGEGWP